MHIVELRIAGFKSFVDPVRLTIEAGLTGVVGPNGCGKSNLLEAVRWGMGATSAKAMRAGDMDDVIFAGSTGRPAREHAEVVLVLDAPEAKAAMSAHGDTLEIARKIRRGAGSSYRLNGREVRAKDVQLLFADASTGANSPALVRQGQISELIAARPENRRRILEEAAGVAGLHARRHEADLKLSAASANLDRLQEIGAEIEAQRAALKRQARLAERYRGLAEDIRRLEALALSRRHAEAAEAHLATDAAARSAERAVADAAQAASAAARATEEALVALGPLREEEMIAAAVLRRLEGERVGLERDLQEAEAAAQRARTELARIAGEAERERALAADAATALQRLEAESASLAIADDCAAHDEARGRAADAAKRRGAAETALDTARAASLEARAERRRLEAALAEARAGLARSEAKLAEAARQLTALPPIERLALDRQAAAERAEAAQRAAEAAATESESAEQAAKAAEAAFRQLQTAAGAAERARTEAAAEVRALRALAQTASLTHQPALAEIEADPGYERAVAAALGDDAEASLAPEAPAHWRGARVRDLAWPEGASPLARHVRAPSALAARIAACAVVDAEQGPLLAPSLAQGARLVTRAGDLWRWDGLVRRADAPSPVAARLEQKNRLAALVAGLTETERTAAEAKAAADAARSRREQAETRLRSARAAAPASLSEALRAQAALDAAEAALTRAEERRAALAADETAAQCERGECVARVEALSGALAAAPPIDDTLIHAAQAEADAARKAAADAETALRLIEKAEQQRTARLAAIATEQSAWRTRAASAAARLSALATQDAAAAETLAQSQDKPAAAKAALHALLDQAAAAERRLARAGDDLAKAERASRDAEAQRRATEAALATAREARATAEAHRGAADDRLAALTQACREQFQCAPQELVSRAGAFATQGLAKGPIGEIDKKIERLKAERDAGGPVNLRAEEELEEVEQRIATLARERADVDAAIAKLRQAIGRLNGEARRRLLDAHAIVNQRFGELFGALFEGGQAELRLTEADDPLACGLEIFAQPPGKRLAALSLMSGGEQALTATALIFAVFLANPAPICVLDEVDAPLDDANVDRFCRMLEEMKRRTHTRFLVITHNPVTMSRMDRLFGVTMPERGVSQIVAVDLQRAAELAA